MKQYFLYFILLFAAISCGGDDDICDSGEGTPRMKIKFKNTSNQTKTMDSLYVSADYGGVLVNFGGMKNVDSIMLPLKVDDSPYTDIYFKIANDGDSSKVRVNYTRKPKYVSAACGVKILYENVNSQLLNTNPVISVENAQNSIENEDKTHLFLIF